MKEDKVITIVGLGVVGGSYAIALSKKGYTVYGVNRSKEGLHLAKFGNLLHHRMVIRMVNILCKLIPDEENAALG